MFQPLVQAEARIHGVVERTRRGSNHPVNDLHPSASQIDVDSRLAALGRDIGPQCIHVDRHACGFAQVQRQRGTHSVPSGAGDSYEEELLEVPATNR